MKTGFQTGTRELSCREPQGGVAEIASSGGSTWSELWVPYVYFLSSTFSPPSSCGIGGAVLKYHLTELFTGSKPLIVPPE